MKTQIGFINVPEPLGVKETYSTIKRRLLAEGNFIEATTAECKMTFSKSVIAMIAPIVKKEDDKKIVKKEKKD